MGVQAVIVADIDSPEGMKAGAIEYDEGANGAVESVFYRCPCGCGQMGMLRLRSGAIDPSWPGWQSGWQWDGNREKPTLTPSVHHTYRQNGAERTHWHGWLRAGVWSRA